MWNSSSNIKGTIYVQNQAQKVLLVHELMGQFSDGFWENSRNESWKFWSHCNIEVQDKLGWKPEGKTYASPKGYSVNNKELISYIGERMIAYVKVANAIQEDFSRSVDIFIESAYYEYINTNKGAYESIKAVLRDLKDDSDKAKAKEGYNPDDYNYFINKYKTAKKFVFDYGLKTLAGAFESDYSEKDLRKDLREITKALKTRI
jgi:hypothetical protein